jgi:hypothetical protein
LRARRGLSLIVPSTGGRCCTMGCNRWLLATRLSERPNPTTHSRGSDRTPDGPRRCPLGMAARLRGHLRRAGERGPTRMGREPPTSKTLTLTTYPPCRAQRSLRGQPSRLRMGFVEWMPQCDPRGCKPPCSLRGHPPLRPGRDVLRRSGSSIVWSPQARAVSAWLQTNSVPLRQIACSVTASLRANAIEARFQPMRLARRTPHALSGDHRLHRVISEPAAS